MAVRAGGVHAVAGIAGLSPNEVVVLIRREREQRIAAVDAVGGQAREELVEGVVVTGQRGHVFGLDPGTSPAGRRSVVRMRDVGVRHANVTFLPSSHGG